MNVALIDMPFAFVRSPTAAFGVLKAVLDQNSISSDCFYFSVEFADVIGIHDYDVISGENTDVCFANWFFANAAFPHSDVDRHKKEMLCHMAGYGLSISTIFDIRKRCEHFVKELHNRNWDKYDVFGFTCTPLNLHAALALGRLIKESSPDKIIVYGGNMIDEEFALEFVNKLSWIDYIVVGEGEITFPKLLNRISNNDNVDGINGLAYKKLGQSKISKQQDLIDMNLTPLPEYDDYFDFVGRMDTDLNENNERDCPGGRLELAIEFSRGCYYGSKKCCTFCSLVPSNNQYKPRSPENALQYLKDVHARYPHIKRFYIVDSILPQGYIEKVMLPWSKIKPKQSRLELCIKPWMNRKQVKILADAGVDDIVLGIETFHPEVMKLLRKGQTVTQCMSNLKWARYYKIKIRWLCMFRLPEEQIKWYDEITENCKLLVHLEPPGILNPLIITKNSPYWAEKDTRKFKNLRPWSLYYSIYPSDIDIDKIAFLYDYDDDNYQDISFFELECDANTILSPQMPPGHKKLAQLIQWWRKSDGKLKLEFRSTGVYDNRTGTEKFHKISELQRDILLFCDGPKSLSVIENQFGNIEYELNSLIDKGLLFSAEGRCVSLVISTDKEIAEFEKSEHFSSNISLNVLS